ncbi:hypothetical protein [Bradyrhizobium ottawaense]|uniref:hypothetical protein n=1 Tax=Bradyrhizobium ottawaense TaxID=931866 RepID=UPI0035180077
MKETGFCDNRRTVPLEAIEATVLEGHRADTRGLLRSCVGFFQLGDTLAQRGDLAAQLPYLVAGPVGAALGDFLANVVCFPRSRSG